MLYQHFAKYVFVQAEPHIGLRLYRVPDTYTGMLHIICMWVISCDNWLVDTTTGSCTLRPSPNS